MSARQPALLFEEEELRRLARSVICGQAGSDEVALLRGDGELREQVEARLEACGLSLHISGEGAVAVAESDASELSEMSRAALAICALVLGGDHGSAPKPRLGVAELRERLDGDLTDAYVRRTVVGPLEKRRLVRVVKPGQRAADAYLTAGPMLSAVDRDLIRARLRGSQGAA